MGSELADSVQFIKTIVGDYGGGNLTRGWAAGDATVRLREHWAKDPVRGQNIFLPHNFHNSIEAEDLLYLRVLP